MHKLLFFSRVAFICNICFLLAFLLRYFPFLPDSGFTSTIIILGMVFGIVLNFVLLLVWLILYLRERRVFSPRWLMIANMCFLLFQLIFWMV